MDAELVTQAYSPVLSTNIEFHEEYITCLVKPNLTFHMPFKFPKYKDSSVRLGLILFYEVSKSNLTNSL